MDGHGFGRLAAVGRGVAMVYNIPYILHVFILLRMSVFEFGGHGSEIFSQTFKKLCVRPSVLCVRVVRVSNSGRPWMDSWRANV